MAESLKWYEKAGNESDVARSTRVRLARNLKRYPFPAYASLQQKEEIAKKIKDALISGNSILSREFKFLPLEELSEAAAVSLVERHILSPEFISDRSGKSILLLEDESVSIMVNEEDHLRIQVLKEGLSLTEAAQLADRIDTLLSETLDFAFDKEFGYLTQCPTNVGTGMRASVMLHLPALTENGAMPRISSNLSKLGMTLRGTYGEGSQVAGAMCQLSNQITLGLTEKEAVENLQGIASQLIEEERRARKKLSESIAFQDKILRAAGLLRSAKMLSSEEFSQLISLIRIGLSTGVLHGVGAEEINALAVKVQPAALMVAAGKTLDQNERDILRAKMTREVCMKIGE